MDVEEDFMSIQDSEEEKYGFCEPE